ncbi:hypothetical protein [Streptomyces sp. TLI_105]|uniref:hypothetical protein n=1 Tax=Streptomyces sp. TLI_105 TaxID=1881019 RepID=UPI000898D97C|nr:hypothetical protein [Streptomyces sp. TLI_105]SED07305.1 hypothetical protein SAMN05428939_4121 [Streptomyces sp. TLI_105]
MSEAPRGDGVAHEDRDGDDVPERRAAETAREDDTASAAPASASENPDALDERDELSGQRMVKIEPGPGEGDDELALRRLFQDAVGGMEPSLGSLEHLRRAVPARRARKRQAIVGAAAAAVLIGTAVPAFVHVASSGGLSAANPVNAGHGEQAQGGTGTETGVEGGQSSKAPASNVSPSPGGADGASGKPQRPGSGASGVGPHQTLGADPGSTPRCTAEQLGVVREGAEGADSEGKVHGTFRIANVSDRTCLVDGAGIVGFEARGAADPARISVVRHTSGDGSGLPDPSQESLALALQPSGSYEVKFVWVPSDTCPTTGTTPTPTPTPPTEPPATPTPTATSTPTPTDDPTSGAGGTDSGGAGAGAGAEEGAGAALQLLGEDGAPADGSIVVSHTAEPGGPTASAVIPNACAGTIYRTGTLASS